MQDLYHQQYVLQQIIDLLLLVNIRLREIPDALLVILATEPTLIVTLIPTINKQRPKQRN